jgi:DNA-binding MarR family transcriptional regulator
MRKTRGDHSSAERAADADSIGYLLRQAAAAHRLRMERALADLKITPPQMLALTLLAANPGRSSADIARLAALSTPTVSVIVANLERRGALGRRPHDVHGRVQRLELTALGQQLLVACWDRAKKLEGELAAGLSAAESKTIRAWLTRVAGGSVVAANEPS